MKGFIVIWFFSLLVVIQFVFWVYFILKKKFKAFIFTLISGVFSILLYTNAYLKYVYHDPCEGIDGCFNETGLIFVFIIGLMLLTTLISLTIFIMNRDSVRSKNS